MWLSTLEIGDAQLHSFIIEIAPYVWTEALSGMIFVAAQKLSIVV